MLKLYTLLLAAAFYLAACSSAHKAYDHGNYTDAVELSVKKLQKDPNNNDLKVVLKDAYKYAVAQHEEQIRNLSASNETDRWERVYAEYAQLQNLYTTIQQSPAAMQAVKPTSYADYMLTFKNKAADVHTELGKTLMETPKPNRLNFKEAYREFTIASGFKPNDIALTELARKAKEAATLNVLIIPMDNNSGYMYNTSYQVKNFQNDIVRVITNNINNPFINFYTKWDARSTSVTPDQTIEMHLGNIIVGRAIDENKTRQVSQEVVTKEIVYRKDSVVKQYGKVYATITSTKRTLVSNAAMYVTLRDEAGQVLWNDNIDGEHRWNTEYATYTGDERALSSSDKTLLNQTSKTPPAEEAIVTDLLRKVQNDVSTRLRNYYNRQ